jgi:hypothetical protein
VAESTPAREINTAEADIDAAPSPTATNADVEVASVGCCAMLTTSR